MQKAKFKDMKILVIVALLIASFFLPMIGSLNVVFAEDKVYSDVLSDLQKDDSFNAFSYPANPINYSLQVIQIAESEDKELFVYVYNPSSSVKELRATSINISTNKNEGIYISDDEEGKSYINYKLELLNSNGVFYKYKVLDFVVSEEAERYYNISNIFRAFDYTLDEPATGDNTISEVGNVVGKVWTAQTVEGQVQYTCTEVETIEITSKYVGFVRYYNGFKLYDSSCDSHYVAFSTDKPIDKLIEAEVYYAEHGVTEVKELGITNTFEEPTEEKYVFLNYIQKASNPAGGLFGHKYTWNRIESVSDFKQGLEDDGFDMEDVSSELEGKDWVLRFCETDYIVAGSIISTKQYTKVEDVSILRLKFETDGKVYSLGVVDNKQSGDLIPDNKSKPWWNWLVIAAIYIFLLIVLFTLFPSALQFVWNIITKIFNGIWWVITAPFSIFDDKK